jgi:glycosyltransferase involved in cell wall biosynthesis
MRIAVSATFLENNHAEVYTYAQECVTRVAMQHPEHSFIFISDRAVNNELSSLQNVTVSFVKPTNAILRRQFWYYYKLPMVLKKQQADLLVNANGVCSLGTKVPQVSIMHDLSFLEYPQAVPKKQLRFYKKNTEKFIRKLKALICFSTHAKEQLLQHYQMDGSKISVVQTGVNECYQPLDQYQKELVKEQYAEGKEFFLYAGNIDATKNITHLLKAFSLFKKRQQSNMQLLIIAPLTAHTASLSVSLKTYKYKTEVKLITAIPEAEMAKIIASAYAFVYPVLTENTGIAVLQAMQCKIPVIASSINELQELCGDAAIYAEPGSIDDIADKMMLLFKDEKKRNDLIDQESLRPQQYSWNNAAAVLWATITKAVE